MKFILFITISILIISTATFGVLYYKERNKYDRLEIKSTLDRSHLKSKNESLKGAFLDSQNYNNTELTLPTSAKSKNNILYLFISKNHCIACVHTALEYYVSNTSLISDTNIVILADFDPNATMQLKAEHQLKCKIISVFAENLRIAENKYPCFFVHNNITSKTEMFLFPIKNESEMMKKYFENVNLKYFAHL